MRSLDLGEWCKIFKELMVLVNFDEQTKIMVLL